MWLVSNDVFRFANLIWGLRVRTVFMKNCAKMVARTFFGVCLVSLYSGQASGQTVQDQVNGATVFSSIPVNITQKFKPSPSKKAKLDFENWDHFLDSIILYTVSYTHLTLPTKRIV